MRVGMLVERFALAVGIILAVDQSLAAQTHTDPQKLFLTRWRPPAGQRCFVNKKPVPVLEEVFDTVGLYRVIANLGTGTIVVAFAPADTAWRKDYGPRPDSMAIIETTLPDTLGPVVRNALLRTLTRPLAVPFLVRLDLRDHPLLQLAPALVCPPKVSGTDSDSVSTILRSVGSGRRRTFLQLIVRPDGTTTAARISTTSGDPHFDEAALTIVPLLQFTPGLLNRVAIPVLVQFPVDVR